VTKVNIVRLEQKDLIKDNIVFTYKQIGDACASSLFAFC